MYLYHNHHVYNTIVCTLRCTCIHIVEHTDINVHALWGTINVNISDFNVSGINLMSFT